MGVEQLRIVAGGERQRGKTVQPAGLPEQRIALDRLPAAAPAGRQRGLRHGQPRRDDVDTGQQGIEVVIPAAIGPRELLALGLLGQGQHPAFGLPLDQTAQGRPVFADLGVLRRDQAQYEVCEERAALLEGQVRPVAGKALDADAGLEIGPGERLAQLADRLGFDDRAALVQNAGPDIHRGGHRHEPPGGNAEGAYRVPA